MYHRRFAAELRRLHVVAEHEARGLQQHSHLMRSASVPRALAGVQTLTICTRPHGSEFGAEGLRGEVCVCVCVCGGRASGVRCA